ncbi:hypothetical protein R20943_07072 [Paraburkholderia aspalathi]|nr:hypothetical protein R20943_07072 [Paraburkholderia aspalathi]
MPVHARPDTRNTVFGPSKGGVALSTEKRIILYIYTG